MKSLCTILLTSICCILTSASTAQNCGVDLCHQHLKNNPNYATTELEQNQLINKYLLANQNAGGQKSTYTIPVVYHIIHNNGPENVSDATILQSLAELNDRLENLAPFNSNIGVDMDLEFCLATIDPFGNATTGITRDQSSLTYMPSNFLSTDVALKNLNRWSPATYLNIWVVADIGGFPAGYAFYPTANNAAADGVVMEYGQLTNSYIAAHEVGHYLNLYHTFDSGICDNFNCLLDGDQVCDTPPDVSTSGCGGNSCSTDMSDTTGMSPFTSDVPELPNYMDYSNCPTLSFTNGQKARSHAALNVLRPSLLLSNGCGANPGGALPVAAFSVDSSGCTGTFAFASNSTNALYTAWDFEDDGLVDAVGANVMHAFTNSGLHDIRVIVTGYGGSDTLVQTIYVHALPTTHYPIASYIGIANDPFLQDQRACKGSTITFNGEPGMASYLWSNGATTQTLNLLVDSATSVYLTTVDQNGYTWSGCIPVSFEVNPQLSFTANIGDTAVCGDYVQVTVDPVPYYNVPNNTWTANGAVVATNQFVYPSGAWDVGLTEISLVNTDINGCTLSSIDTFRYTTLAFPTPTITQQGNVLTLSSACPLGNNWFKDGVVVQAANDTFLVINDLACYHAGCYACDINYTDTMCVASLTVGLEEVPQTVLRVFPNPLKDFVTIALDGALGPATVRIYEMSGRLVLAQTFRGSSQLQVNLEQLAQGTYLLEVDVAGSAGYRQIVIKE